MPRDRDVIGDIVLKGVDEGETIVVQVKGDSDFDRAISRAAHGLKAAEVSIEQTNQHLANSRRAVRRARSLIAAGRDEI